MQIQWICSVPIHDQSESDGQRLAKVRAREDAIGGSVHVHLLHKIEAAGSARRSSHPIIDLRTLSSIVIADAQSYCNYFTLILRFCAAILPLSPPSSSILPSSRKSQ